MANDDGDPTGRSASGSGPSSTIEGHGQTRRSGRRFKERAAEEMLRFLVLFLYLWLLFGLFALQERIILHQHGLNFTRQGFAVFNALVLAKVMLVAEDLNLGRWLERRPLIYPILHESLVFALIFIGFHVLEHVVVGVIKGGSVAASVPAIGGGGLVGLICVALILFVALVPYFAFRNLARSLGSGRLNALLFGAIAKSPGEQ